MNTKLKDVGVNPPLFEENSKPGNLQYTVKEFNQKIHALTNQNFELKVQLYHAEMQVEKLSGPQDLQLFKENVQLKLEKERLEKELISHEKKILSLEQQQFTQDAAKWQLKEDIKGLEDKIAQQKLRITQLELQEKSEHSSADEIKELPEHIEVFQNKISHKNKLISSLYSETKEMEICKFNNNIETTPDFESKFHSDKLKDASQTDSQKLQIELHAIVSERDSLKRILKEKDGYIKNLEAQIALSNNDSAEEMVLPEGDNLVDINKTIQNNLLEKLKYLKGKLTLTLNNIKKFDSETATMRETANPSSNNKDESKKLTKIDSISSLLSFFKKRVTEFLKELDSQISHALKYLNSDDQMTNEGEESCAQQSHLERELASKSEICDILQSRLEKLRCFLEAMLDNPDVVDSSHLSHTSILQVRECINDSRLLTVSLCNANRTGAMSLQSIREKFSLSNEEAGDQSERVPKETEVPALFKGILDQNKSARDNLIEYQSEIMSLKEQLKEANNLVQSKVEEIKGLQQKCTQMRDLENNEFLKKHIRDIDGELSTLKTNLIKLTLQNQAKEKQSYQFTKQKEILEKDMLRLQEELKASSTKIEKAGNKLLEVEKSGATLQASLTSRIARLELQLTQTEGITRLKDDLFSKLQATLAVKNKLCEVLNKQLEELKKENTFSSDLQTRLSGMSMENEGLQFQLTELKTELITKHNDYSELMEKIQGYDTIHQELKEEVLKLTTKYAKKEENFLKLVTLTKEKDEQIEVLHQQLSHIELVLQPIPSVTEDNKLVLNIEDPNKLISQFQGLQRENLSKDEIIVALKNDLDKSKNFIDELGQLRTALELENSSLNVQLVNLNRQILSFATIKNCAPTDTSAEDTTVPAANNELTGKSSVSKDLPQRDIDLSANTILTALSDQTLSFSEKRSVLE